MAEVSLWLEDGSKSICDTITATRVGVGIKIEFLFCTTKRVSLVLIFQIGEIQSRTQFMMKGYLEESLNKKFW